MICPSCKCEYIRGVTQCPDCDVALVDTLGSVPPTPLGNEGVVSIWSGDDPVEVTAVKHALEKADIQYVDQSSNAYFILRSMRPKTEILVSSADEERARNALRELPEGGDLDDLAPEEIKAMELPEIEDTTPAEDARAPDDIPAEDGDEEATSEIWNGDSEVFADSLIACLREIGIASRKISESNLWRVVVRPEQESRAREIVREVVEASPPE